MSIQKKSIIRFDRNIDIYIVSFSETSIYKAPYITAVKCASFVDDTLLLSLYVDKYVEIDMYLRSIALYI